MSIKDIHPVLRISILMILALALSFPHVSHAGYSESSYYAEGGYYSQSAYNISVSNPTTFTGSVVESITLAVTGTVGKGSGFFVIDHPLDPKNKLLYHSFVESPDVKNLYDGVATLDKNGEATITLPSYFEALNKDFRYQLKPIGEPMPGLYIKSEIANNRFTIGGGEPRGRVSWQVTGTRRDAYILANPIIVEVKKGPQELANIGEYLHPEIYPQSIAPYLTRLLNQLRELLRP